MRRFINFVLIILIIGQFHSIAQEVYLPDGNDDFYAGQTENTFNYKWDLEGSINEYYLDLDDDGNNDLYFEREIDSQYGGEVVYVHCYVQPLQGTRISYKTANLTEGLDYGEMIYPSDIIWSDQKLKYLITESIEEWFYFSWEWYLDEGYLGVQIPKENDTLNAWVYLNFEVGSYIEVLEIDSHTCWKPCVNPPDLNDSIVAYVNDTIIIDAGQGYDSCFWSTGDTSQAIEVACSEWGVGDWEISVEAIEGVCYYFDTIIILIKEDTCTNTLNLVNSIMAYLHDTISIDAGQGYDSYNWSTGDTSQTIELICSEWGMGEWEIRLEAVEGACHYFDSINILIEDDSGIPTGKTTPIQFGPNPFDDQITIRNPLENDIHFDVVNMLGITVFSMDIPPGNTIVSLGFLKTGLYLGSIYNRDQRMLVKMIKK